MADRTSIEWSDASWNPIAGCTRVSEACRNCYATPIAARFSDTPAFAGTAHFVDRPDGTREARWTGAINVRENLMDLPLRWKRPRRIFVNSVSDLFHDAVPAEVIDRIFAVMALCPQHTFQILTKRPERMRQYLTDPATPVRIARVILDEAREWGVKGKQQLEPLGNRAREEDPSFVVMPLPNVWLGVTAEDQDTADVRVSYLHATPAAIRFVSYEPALGLIDWSFLLQLAGTRLDLVIMGGESGPNARPMHPDWVRQTRDQCAAAGVPFFFKQWGEWVPSISGRPIAPDGSSRGPDDWNLPSTAWMDRVGKRAAGRLLDGVEHNRLPAAS